MKSQCQVVNIAVGAILLLNDIQILVLVGLRKLYLQLIEIYVTNSSDTSLLLENMWL